MKYSLTLSDSLIYSLCREIEYIRQRSKNIKDTLYTCKDKFLQIRLVNEIKGLTQRINELNKISNEYKNKYNDSISSKLLIELCNRSLKINI